MDDLAARLTGLTFTGLTRDEVTARILDEVAAWGRDQGWRVYRRAPSVVRLPPPMDKQHSVLDVALARPAAPPVVVEVDHTDRKRTIGKLLAEADAGRVAVWVRWGPGRFTAPPAPIRMITLPVTRHQGRYARSAAPDRPAPNHSPVTAATTEQPLPLPAGPDGSPAGPAGSPAGPGERGAEPGEVSAEPTEPSALDIPAHATVLPWPEPFDFPEPPAGPEPGDGSGH